MRAGMQHHHGHDARPSGALELLAGAHNIHLDARPSGASELPAGAHNIHLGPRLGQQPTAPTLPDADRSTASSTSTDPDLPWDVIVWDDPVTLMSYVVWVFKKILGVTEAVATKLMLEVHNNGKALVASQPREQAEFTLQRLHAHGLQATIQQSR